MANEQCGSDVVTTTSGGLDSVAVNKAAVCQLFINEEKQQRAADDANSVANGVVDDTLVDGEVDDSRQLNKDDDHLSGGGGLRTSTAPSDEDIKLNKIVNTVLHIDENELNYETDENSQNSVFLTEEKTHSVVDDATSVNVYNTPLFIEEESDKERRIEQENNKHSLYIEESEEENNTREEEKSEDESEPLLLTSKEETGTDDNKRIGSTNIEIIITPVEEENPIEEVKNVRRSFHSPAAAIITKMTPLTWDQWMKRPPSYTSGKETSPPPSETTDGGDKEPKPATTDDSNKTDSETVPQTGGENGSPKATKKTRFQIIPQSLDVLELNRPDDRSSKREPLEPCDEAEEDALLMDNAMIDCHLNQLTMVESQLKKLGKQASTKKLKPLKLDLDEDKKPPLTRTSSATEPEPGGKKKGLGWLSIFRKRAPTPQPPTPKSAPPVRSKQQAPRRGSHQHHHHHHHHHAPMLAPMNPKILVVEVNIKNIIISYFALTFLC